MALANIATFLFGDPTEEGLKAPVTTYEDLHAETQLILIPSTYPKGVSVDALQPISKSFALNHRLYLETSNDAGMGALAAMFGGGAPPKGDHRSYSLGGVYTTRTQQNAKLRAYAALSTRGAFKTVALADAFGNGRLRFLLQSVLTRKDAPEIALSTFLRGPDYAATLRVKTGPEVGLSYHQRLSDSSPITVGGEAYLNTQQLKAATTGSAAERPITWAFGAAYDAGINKTGVHLAATGRSVTALSCHHLYRINERCSLAAKTIIDVATFSSMAAIGYRLKFRNTLATVTGTADTYGNLKLVVDREPVKDMRVGLSMTCNLWPSKGKGKPQEVGVGLKISAGAVSPVPQPLSPCTLSRGVFSTQ